MRDIPNSYHYLPRHKCFPGRMTQFRQGAGASHFPSSCAHYQAQRDQCDTIRRNNHDSFVHLRSDPTYLLPIRAPLRTASPPSEASTTVSFRDYDYNHQRNFPHNADSAIIVAADAPAGARGKCHAGLQQNPRRQVQLRPVQAGRPSLGSDVEMGS